MLKPLAFRKSFRQLLRKDGSVEQVDGPGRFYVLSRALCHHVSVDLPAEWDRSKREKALALRVAAQSPFETSGHFAVWDSMGAQVWIWDRAMVEEALTAGGADPSRVQILPESVFRPKGEGVRIIACLDGVEGQAWTAGRLAACRWWPELPSAREWLQFCRTARATSQAVQVPLAQSLPLLDQPWGQSAGLARWLPAGATRSDLAVAAAVLLLLPIGYQAGRLVGFEAAGDRLAAQVELQEEGARDVRRSRGEALALGEELWRFERLSPYPNQLTLMAEVVESLPESTSLLAWTFDRGTIYFRIAADEPLDVFVVANAMREVVALDAVQVEPMQSPNILSVRAIVREVGA